MNITYRSLTDKELKRARQFRLRSFIAFMGIGAVLVVMAYLLGAPYGMRPAGWPWSPADWYGVNLGLLLAAMLFSGGFLVFSQKMLQVDVLVRRKSSRVIYFAIPMTILSLTLLLFGALFLFRMTMVAWTANNDGWRPGVVWSTPRSDDPIIHVAVAADGQSMHAWYKSNNVRTWMLGRGTELATAASPATGPVSLSSAAFAQHEKRLTAAGVTLELTGSNDLTLRQKDGKERSLSPRPLAATTCLALGADGDPALSGNKDGGVQVWDTSSGREVRVLDGKSAVSAVALTPNGIKAASGHEDGRIRIWNMKNGNELKELKDSAQTSTAPVSVLAFNAASNRLASMSAKSSTLYLWDVDNFKLFSTPIDTQIQDATHLALSPDGRYAIIVANKSIHVLRLGPG
jgi:hypothetical protein